MKLYSAFLVGLLLFAPTTGAVAADCNCEYADKASLKTGAERILNDFSTDAGGTSDRKTGVLTISVENTPALIYVDIKQQNIVVPWWPELDPNIQDIFIQLAGDYTSGKHLFNLLFNQFFIPHEAGHWLQSKSHVGVQGGKQDLYRYEAEANQIAVAYWMTTPGGEAYLQEMEDLLGPILAQLQSPVPAGSKPDEYFNSHYAELGENPKGYGWFQFRFVLDALAQRNNLQFPDLVKNLLTPNSKDYHTKHSGPRNPTNQDF